MRPVYKAEDGSEYETAKAAERRNELKKASLELEAAAKKVKRLLGESANTADGYSFDMSHSCDYWRIRHGMCDLPMLTRVNIWPHNVDVDLDKKDGQLVVREYINDGRGQNYYDHRVCELYKNEEKAKAAWIEACRKKLVRMQEQLVECEKNLPNMIT